MSAFLAFSNERRGEVAEANPNLGNAEISRVLSRMWKEAPDHIRKKYREREAEERANFKMRMTEWKKGKSSTASSPADSSVSSPGRSPANLPHKEQMQPFTGAFSNGSRTQEALELCAFEPTATYHESDVSDVSQPRISQAVSMSNKNVHIDRERSRMLSCHQEPLICSRWPHSHEQSNESSSGSLRRSNTIRDATGNARLWDEPGTFSGDDRIFPHYGEINGSADLEPLIDTDTGGYLAKFAELENTTEANLFNSK